VDKKGFSIIELLVIFIIIFILAGISCKVVYSVVQRAKVVSAKAQISQLALLMEKVKEDTGYYCVHDTYLLRGKDDAPSGQKKGWNGPYIENRSEMPDDPWGHKYVYEIPPTEFVGKQHIKKGQGSPDWEPVPPYPFYYEGEVDTAILHIENGGATSVSVELNGVEVVHEYQFKKYTEIIDTVVTLNNPGYNYLRVKVKSGGDKEIISISISGYIPTDKYFIFKSYGKDGVEGGKGFNKDIIWKSDTYPHFQ